jgi:hypothetical protein
MAENELSLIRFNVTNYYAVLINAMPFQPIGSKLIKLVESLIHSEPEPDKENLARLKWLYKNTHKNVMVMLPLVELAVYKNLDRGLSREIEIYDKPYYLTELYNYLDELTSELTQIVISIAKKYSIDIPLMQGMEGQKFSFGGK